MNFKLNWGQSLFLALALFVIFIGSFVYKTLMMDDYNHTLVSDDYYKEEIHYQKEIDRLNNAATLKQNLVVNKTSEGLEIIFPNSFNYNTIIAHLKLQHVEKSEHDIKKMIDLDSLTYLIPDKHLVKGRYSLKLNWEYDTIPYQFKQMISY